jgi:hypothetical protein
LATLIQSWLAALGCAKCAGSPGSGECSGATRCGKYLFTFIRTGAGGNLKDLPSGSRGRLLYDGVFADRLRWPRR